MIEINHLNATSLFSHKLAKNNKVLVEATLKVQKDNVILDNGFSLTNAKSQNLIKNAELFFIESKDLFSNKKVKTVRIQKEFINKNISNKKKSKSYHHGIVSILETKMSFYTGKPVGFFLDMYGVKHYLPKIGISFLRPRIFKRRSYYSTLKRVYNFYESISLSKYPSNKSITKYLELRVYYFTNIMLRSTFSLRKYERKRIIVHLINLLLAMEGKLHEKKSINLLLVYLIYKVKKVNFRGSYLRFFLFNLIKEKRFPKFIIRKPVKAVIVPKLSLKKKRKGFRAKFSPLTFIKKV